ncbi:abortive infection system antitoxin AbiGi family protein [Bacillus sp. Wb]
MKVYGERNIFPNKKFTRIQGYSYKESNQSANCLFKFMSKLDYLKEIIEKSSIIPRYYEERIDYLKIKNIKKIAIPMSCFCDIHLKNIALHINNYGSYGIGIDKGWGISKGIQPILYMNENSPLRKDFSFSLRTALETKGEVRLKELKNLIQNQLLFMKPIEGEMLIYQGQYRECNFHDEKEWRYVPDLNNSKTELRVLTDQEHMNESVYNHFSNGIRENPKLWLKLKLDAINYLIVKNEEDRIDMINFIRRLQNVKEEIDKDILISKIQVFDSMRGDM